MKILFLVHVEPEFENLFPDNYLQFVKLAARKFDKVIALDSGIGQGTYREIVSLPNVEVREWSWGYEWGYDYGNGIECTIESKGHDATWVPEFMFEDDFSHCSIVVAGGCDGECLSDWESVLEHLGLPYRRWEHLIWGF